MSMHEEGRDGLSLRSARISARSRWARTYGLRCGASLGVAVTAYHDGQFLIRRDEYEAWGIQRFRRVGSMRPEGVYYTTAWGMQLGTRGAWVWGPFSEPAVQASAAILDKFYRPATEEECAAVAEERLRKAHA